MSWNEHILILPPFKTNGFAKLHLMSQYILDNSYHKKTKTYFWSTKKKVENLSTIQVTSIYSLDVTVFQRVLGNSEPIQ